jgi:hypothetical protein
VSERLPSVDDLERVSLAIAALDCVLSPEWDQRKYSFDPAWGDGERMASMRDGFGNVYQIVFGPDGTVVRGFDHESELSPYRGRSLAPGLLDGFPDVLRPVVDEPAFNGSEEFADLTFCAWRLDGDVAWSAGPVEDLGGSAERLFDVVLDATPDGYRRFAADYYEEELSLDVLRPFYELRPADALLVLALSGEADVAATLAELRETGYPTSEDSAVSS